jgi:preprotein translocase subunit SecB
MKPSPLQLERHFFTKIAVDAHHGADPRTKPQVEAEVDLAPAQHDPRRYQVTLRVKVVAPPEKKSCYTAEVHVVGLVQVAPSWPQNQVHQLVQANGGALLYGAAREMLCNLTARGPWPMLCLHSVTFVQPAKAPSVPTVTPAVEARKA